MTQYKKSIISAMKMLARNKKTVFIGYNTVCGSRMYGTLSCVPHKQCIETPVAENLMVGLAMGMSLEGYRPVVCFERTNFLYAAADAIRHHLCMLPALSGEQFTFPVVIRAVEGYWKPLDPGEQHHSGRAYEFAKVLGIQCRICPTPRSVEESYKIAATTHSPILIIEDKGNY